ncbi:MAG: dihydroneopterin aldolase [Muribaculaceae bacterium]|nr:dihydroneopterin aldolase [Muribaculaceae bacterium]
MKITGSTIEVRDIEIYAHHGVFEQEHKSDNEFRVSVSLDYDARTAMVFDDYCQAVDYAQIIDIVREEMAKPAALIEHVTQRLINALTEAFPTVTAGRVSVTKVHPPVSTPIAGATFTATFTV